MFESFILGAVQGIAEWLPVSSEAMIVLVKTNFFPDGTSFSENISLAIFLHLGTLLAVVVYYRKKLWRLVQDFFQYKQLESQRKNYLSFIIIATMVSGILGVVLLKIVEHYEYLFINTQTINIIVAVFLSITAILLYISENKKGTGVVQLSWKRALGTGLFQGLAAIPGISRSGSTVAGMGLLGIDKERALELSFILSVPLVLFANVILNFKMIQNLSFNNIVGLASAFVFGLATIAALLQIVKKIRFSYFVGIFVILLIIFSILV